jgi:uncharacterized protein
VTPRPFKPLPQSPADQEVLELSWDVFGELCRALALKVIQAGYMPDLVIGIAKAGVIPGAVVASILRCDFFSMKISRRAGAEVVRERPQILSAAPPQASGRSVLIVDEVCTSGDTLRMALTAVRHVLPDEVKTATALVKHGGFKPDFYAMETAATVIFPWDRQVVSDAGELVVNPLYRELIP